MSKPTLTLKNGLLFPFLFQVLGYVFLFIGLFLLMVNIWVSIIFFLLAGLIVFAYSGIEFRDKQFREFNAFFFMKFGEWKTYQGVESLYIKRIKTTQKMYGRANQSSIIKGIVYKAFVKFENGSRVLVLENKKKDKLKQKLKVLAENLQAEIRDYDD